MRSRRIVSVLVLLVLALALASPVAAQGNGKPGLVAFGRDITVTSGEVISGDVVAFGGNIIVEPQGKVTGGTVAFGGNITCAGDVGGSVVSFGGNIELQAGSLVRQDVAALGGDVTQAQGSRVEGNVSKGFVFSMHDFQSGRNVSPPVTISPNFTRGSDSLLASLIIGMLRAVVTVLVLTAVAIVLVAIFPKPVEGVRATLAAQPAASTGIGCLAYVAAIAITVPLIITCIGPFLLWTAIAIGSVFGLAAAGLWLGERLLAAAGGRHTPLASAAFGTATLVLLLSIADVTPFLNCFGWVLWLLVSCLALGAVVWSRFGTQVPPGVTGSPVSGAPAPLTGAITPSAPTATPSYGSAADKPGSTASAEIVAELAAAERPAGSAAGPGQGVGG